MYPSYDPNDQEGYDQDGDMLPYLTPQAVPMHNEAYMSEFGPHTSSTAAGKPTCFSTEPDTQPDEWRRKPREHWTVNDVFHWIPSVAANYNFSYEDVNAHNFSVDGRTLLGFSRQDFENRDPTFGSLLYESLHGGSSSNTLPDPYNELQILSQPHCSKYEPVEVKNSPPPYDESTDVYAYPPHAPHPPENSDYSIDTESEPEEPPPKIKRPPGRPPGPRSKAKAEKKTGRLWEFIRNLLHNPEFCPSLICWEDHDQGVFRFVKSEKVAKIWGKRKNNEKMNYEKLSRAMRYYYKSKVLLPVLGRKLVYKFGPNAKGWRTDNPNFRNPQ